MFKPEHHAFWRSCFCGLFYLPTPLAISTKNQSKYDILSPSYGCYHYVLLSCFFFFILIEVTSLAQTVLFCAALEGPVSLWHATNRPRQGCIPVYYDSAVGCHTNPWLQHSFENEESNLICLYIPVYEVVYWHLECIIHEKFKHMHLQTHTK